MKVDIRRMRTTQERRANQEGFVRAKRRPHNLPDAYDDVWVFFDRSWKSRRKSQYRVVNV